MCSRCCFITRDRISYVCACVCGVTHSFEHAANAVNPFHCVRFQLFSIESECKFDKRKITMKCDGGSGWNTVKPVTVCGRSHLSKWNSWPITLEKENFRVAQRKVTIRVQQKKKTSRDETIELQHAHHGPWCIGHNENKYINHGGWRRDQQKIKGNERKKE